MSRDRSGGRHGPIPEEPVSAASGRHEGSGDVPLKHERISATLADEIAAGRFTPGAQLPGEVALARRFGVSRTTVRAALADLTRGGLIATRTGKGSFVQPRGVPRAARLASASTIEERALGALLGLAIGDALGMPTQLLSRDQIVDAYGPLLSGFEPAPPGHPIAAGMTAGQVTDDTEQAVILAEVLIAGGGVDRRPRAGRAPGRLGGRHAGAGLARPAGPVHPACAHRTAGRRRRRDHRTQRRHQRRRDADHAGRHRHRRPTRLPSSLRSRLRAGSPTTRASPSPARARWQQRSAQEWPGFGYDAAVEQALAAATSGAGEGTLGGRRRRGVPDPLGDRAGGRPRRRGRLRPRPAAGGHQPRDAGVGAGSVRAVVAAPR